MNLTHLNQRPLKSRRLSSTMKSNMCPSAITMKKVKSIEKQIRSERKILEEIPMSKAKEEKRKKV